MPLNIDGKPMSEYSYYFVVNLVIIPYVLKPH